MERQALANLIDRYGNDIYRYCYHLAMNREEADDLYQDTFLKAVMMSHRLESVAPAPSQETEEVLRKDRNFLIGIATNLWKNRYRKLKRRREVVSSDQFEGEFSVDSGIDVQADLEKQEILHGLRREIRELPEKLRVVIHLYYTAEMGTGEISRVLHIPAGTVMSRLHLARKRLRERLEEKGYEI